MKGACRVPYKRDSLIMEKESMLSWQNETSLKGEGGKRDRQAEKGDE